MKRQADLADINRFWNHRIPYKRHNNGLLDIVSAVQNGGECHDYVHAKGRQLQGEGLPTERLEIGIGTTNGVPHSVLIVDDQVLDNLHDDLRPIDDYGNFERLPFSTFFK